MRIPRQYPSPESALLADLRPLLNFRPSHRYREGIGDDAAIRRCAARESLVLTVDALVENVDFSLNYMTLGEVGFKAMAVNLSDCAAMGAEPDGALVTVTFPASCSGLGDRMVELYRGINRACRRWNFPVVGGDLSSGPAWAVTVTLVGRAGGRILRRTGARQGDGLWVSGTPGDSAAGLGALRHWGGAGARRRCPGLVKRHIAPTPRVEAGIALSRDRRVHAAIDVSDGISKECHTLAFENRLGVVLDGDALPLSPGARKLAARLGRDPLSWFLHGGEDFELLLAAAPGFNPRAVEAAAKVRLTRIGSFVKGEHVRLRTRGEVHEVKNLSWDHLQAVPRQPRRTA